MSSSQNGTPHSPPAPGAPSAQAGPAAPARAVYRLPLVETPSPGEAAPAPRQADGHLLAQNIRWFCTLRWVVVAALAAFGGLAFWPAPAEGLSGVRWEADWPWAVAGTLAVLNLGYMGWSRAAPALAIGCLWTQILLDLVLLTVVVHFLGSLETFAPSMYLFHIVLACIFFPYAESLVVTLSAVGMYTACVAAETLGLLPAASVFAAPAAGGRSALPVGVVLWQVGWVAFVSGTVWYLASRIAAALRQREQELAVTNQRLMAATEERARHMLRTTHQLKAPFAAIHANAQLLLGGYCGQIGDSARTVVQQISARCEMLSREIKEMLQLANLRSAAQRPPPRAPVELAALVRGSVANLAASAADRNIGIEEALTEAWVEAVPDHVVMLIDNVVANAVNYSYDGGKVSVSCRPTPEGGAVVAVRDRGIGIAPDKLPRIFDDYFRTNEAAGHNKASTGLGLAIVRQVAVSGRLGVQVESAPDQGTILTVEFPGGRLAGTRGQGVPHGLPLDR